MTDLVVRPARPDEYERVGALTIAAYKTLDRDHLEDGYDEQILDVAGIITAPTEWGQWDAGGGSNDTTPTPSTVYLDDATISLTRVGTGL